MAKHESGFVAITPTAYVGKHRRPELLLTINPAAAAKLPGFLPVKASR